MAMSGGSATVPAWWTKLKQPQAHERLVGSIEFYRNKWEGGAHWRSSEDDVSQKARVNSFTQPSHRETVSVPKEWPGYSRKDAREGYITRFDMCKTNRKAFERSSQKSNSPSCAAIEYAKRQREAEVGIANRKEAHESRQNYFEREQQRSQNKVLATEASELIRPRPGANTLHPKRTLNTTTTLSEKSDWYGRRNTRPW